MSKHNPTFEILRGDLKDLQKGGYIVDYSITSNQNRIEISVQLSNPVKELNISITTT